MGAGKAASLSEQELRNQNELLQNEVFSACYALAATKLLVVCQKTVFDYNVYVSDLKPSHFILFIDH